MSAKEKDKVSNIHKEESITKRKKDNGNKKTSVIDRYILLL